MSKIALGMIVKGSGDEPAYLERCLSHIEGHVDKTFITVTGSDEEYKKIEEVVKGKNVVLDRAPKDVWFTADKKTVDWLKDFFGYEPQLKEGDTIFLFDRARNHNMEQTKDYEWFLWLDVDDVLRSAKNLRHVVELAEKNQVEAVYFNYLYQVEVENGRVKHVIIEHLRERLLRNNGIYKWIAPIHETLIEQKPTKKADDTAFGEGTLCDVVHLTVDERRIAAIYRNMKNLEYSIYQTEGKDPRPIFYLAKAYYDLRKDQYDDAAIPLINQYLLGEHKSGWPEERAQAWSYLAEIYRRKDQHNNSIKALMNSLIEFPEIPDTYLQIAISYMLKGQWDRSLFWVRKASETPELKTTLIKNPKDYKLRMMQVIYNCSLNLSKIDEAWAAAQKMIEIEPNDESIKGAYAFIKQLYTQRNFTRTYIEIVDYLKKSGEVAKIKPLLASAPNLIVNTPFIQDIYKKNMPPKFWDDNEVAIYCGPGFTNWSPLKLKNPEGSFIGGSEEAVIRLSQELSKLGWRVTVYADPGEQEGEYEGVKWLPYYKFNLLDHFNILVFWRVIQYVDQNAIAKKIYVWNHDIQNNLEYTKERIDKIDKVFFLSKWHRDNVPALPDEKVVISSNGI